MKDGIFDIVIELILTVILVFFIPMELYGMEEERLLRGVIESSMEDFTETVCNQKRITESNIRKLSGELSDTGLNGIINIEVESSDTLYSYDFILSGLQAEGEFRLSDNDYVEVIVKCLDDTMGVRLARIFNPSLQTGWIKVIQGNMVHGGRN